MHIQEDCTPLKKALTRADCSWLQKLAPLSGGRKRLWCPSGDGDFSYQRRLKKLAGLLFQSEDKIRGMQEGTSSGEHHKGASAKLEDGTGETTEVELSVNKFRLKRVVPGPQRGELLQQCPHTNSKDNSLRMALGNGQDYIMLFPAEESNLTQELSCCPMFLLRSLQAESCQESGGRATHTAAFLERGTMHTGFQQGHPDQLAAKASSSCSVCLSQAWVQRASTAHSMPAHQTLLPVATETRSGNFGYGHCLMNTLGCQQLLYLDFSWCLENHTGLGISCPFQMLFFPTSYYPVSRMK